MTPSGIEPATFRFVSQHLNHCATSVPLICFDFIEMWNKKKTYEIHSRINNKLNYMKYKNLFTFTQVVMRISSCPLPTFCHVHSGSKPVNGHANSDSIHLTWKVLIVAGWVMLKNTTITIDMQNEYEFYYELCPLTVTHQVTFATIMLPFIIIIKFPCSLSRYSRDH